MERQNVVWDREYAKRGTAWNRRVLFLPDVFEGKTVLEVGVGDGKTLSAICRKKPGRVVAIDFSIQALKKAQALVDTSVTISFMKADATSMPFGNDAFDVVVLYYILDNLLEVDRKTAVNEAYRVVKLGGVVLFEDFAVGDFREETGKRTGMPEPHTLEKKKGLICHYFTVEEARSLFHEFSRCDVVQKERTPIKNKSHLVRKVINGLMVK